MCGESKAPRDEREIVVQQPRANFTREDWRGQPQALWKRVLKQGRYLLRARVYLPCAVPAEPLLGEIALCCLPIKKL